jgi:hypothetical protein
LLALRRLVPALFVRIMVRRRDNFRADVCKKSPRRIADTRQLTAVQPLDEILVATVLKRKLARAPTITHLLKTRRASGSRVLEFNLARAKARCPIGRMSRDVTLTRDRLVQVSGNPYQLPSSSAST